MAVQARAQVGAMARVGQGAMDQGFTQVAPPGYLAPTAGILSHGSTWVTLGAAAWLAVLYLHFHTY
jgi:hypothetical protein